MSSPYPSAQAQAVSKPRQAPVKRPSITSLLSDAKVSSATRELDISYAHDVTPKVLEVLCDCMPHLRKLAVREVGLTNLPDSVGRLAQLRELDVSNNLLEALPPSIGALQQLQHLNASRNKLGHLPDVLGGMASLRLFNLNYNGLSSLPPSLGHMPALRVLRLGANALTRLPDEMALLHDLRLVQLAYNQLDVAPDVLWQLAELKVVDLSYNAIEIWPKDNVLLTSLSSLNITGNPFVEMPKSLVAAQSHELKIIGLPRAGTKVTQVTLPQPAAPHPDDRMALNGTQDLTGIMFAGLGDFAVSGEPSTSPEVKAPGHLSNESGDTVTGK